MRSRLAFLFICLGLATVPSAASAASNLSVSFTRSRAVSRVVVHRFGGLRRSQKVTFRLHGLKTCEVRWARSIAGRRHNGVSVRTVRRAVRRGRLALRLRGSRPSLEVACAPARARAASAPTAPTTDLNSSISANPLGPQAPQGGWSVQYADSFTEPLCGTAGAQSGNCDNTLYPNGLPGSCAPLKGSNDDEMEEYGCSQVGVGSSGLQLSCKRDSGLQTPSGYDPSNYLCGAVDSVGPSPAGYKFFNWKPGQGQEWAVQITAELPPNTGEADPGFWSIGDDYTEEIDFFEGMGLSAGKGGSWMTEGPGHNLGGIGMVMPAWIYNTSNHAGIGAYCDFAGDLGFDPSKGFHTYTTVFYPNNSFSEYVDGHLAAYHYVDTGGLSNAGSNNGTVAGPVPYNSGATMGLELTYALRDDSDGDPDPYFTSGSRQFTVRSVAFYEDAAADGANSINPGLAPGTSVQGG